MFNETENDSSGRPRWEIRKWLVAAWLTASVATASGAMETNQPSTESHIAAPPSAASLEQKWGIKILGPYLSAGGNVVDFRYQVLDPAKAATLTKRENKPSLVDQVNGAKLIIPNTPKLGPLRQTATRPEKGKVYFMLFANTRHHVKAGHKVTITIGECKLENLTVE